MTFRFVALWNDASPQMAKQKCLISHRNEIWVPTETRKHVHHALVKFEQYRASFRSETKISQPITCNGALAIIGVTPWRHADGMMPQPITAETNVLHQRTFYPCLSKFTVGNRSIVAVTRSGEAMMMRASLTHQAPWRENILLSFSLPR